ncbi:MAG: leucine-rich repeat protein, partial [Oscillospiraceae bacterium]|nr:leucine-rich repeat protein [Oscillospiraceae bacterium]
MAQRVFTREDAKGLIRTNSEKVTLPFDFTEIASGALAGFSQVKSLVIPEGITRIASYAFYTRSFKNTCQIEVLTLPSSLKQFDRWCFYDCNNLKSITVPSDFNEELALELFSHCPTATLFFGKTFSIGKRVVPFAKRKTVQEIMDERSGFLTLGGASMFQIEADGTLVIPANYHTILPNSMKGIATRGIKKIVIPSTIKKIAPGVFACMQTLEEIEVLPGTEYIDPCAFSNCRFLKKITLPETIREIGAGAFMNLPKLEKIKLPPHLEVVADELLSNCFALRRVKFGKNVTKIGAGAFSDCTSIRSIKLPETVKIIEHSAFWNCRSLQRLYIPAGCEKLKQSTLGNCPALEILYMPRIVHDQNETKRIFGDLTNPSITWMEPGMPRPDWHDDENLPELAFDDDEIEEEAAPAEETPVPSDIRIQSAFSDGRKKKIDPESVRQIEISIANMQSQLKNLAAGAGMPEGSVPVDQTMLEQLQSNLSKMQQNYDAVQSLQNSAETLENLQKQIDEFADMQSKMQQISDIQETVEEKVRNLSDLENKVEQIGDVTQIASELSEVKEQVDSISEIKEAVGSIQDIREKVDELSDLKASVETVGSLKEMAGTISDIQEKVSVIDGVQEKIEAIDSAQEKISALDHVQEKIDAIDHAQEKIEHVQEKIEAIDSVQDKIQAINDVSDTVEAISAVQEQVSVIPELQQKVEEISDIQQKVENLTEQVSDVSQLREMADALMNAQEKLDAIPELQQKVDALSGGTGLHADGLPPTEAQMSLSRNETANAAVFADGSIPPQAAAVPHSVQAVHAEAAQPANEFATPVPAVQQAVSFAPVQPAVSYPAAFDQSIPFASVHSGEYDSAEKVFSHEVSKGLAGPVERSNALKNYTVITYRAFCGADGGERFEIPEGVRRVESQAFWDCPRLMALEIPNSLTEIEPDAFSGCTRLTDVYLPADYPDRKAVDLFLFRPEIRLHWPKKKILARPRIETVADLMEQYDDILTAQKMKKLTVRNHILEIPEGYTAIAPYCAKELDLRAEEPEHMLTTVILPKSVRRVTAYAFAGLEAARHIIIQEGLQI